VTLISDSVDSSKTQPDRRPPNPPLEGQQSDSPLTEPQPQLDIDYSESAIAAASAPKPLKIWAIFGSTFVTIFLAEMGDKTQVTTLLMTAESHNPWVVFLGAGSALITTSLLGVLVGRWLASHIQPKTLERAAGITLLLISVLLFWEILH